MSQWTDAILDRLRTEAQMAENGDKPILCRSFKLAIAEIEQLHTALVQCAAPFDTGPTTLSMAPHIISTEFQRRMNIAAFALTSGKREGEA